jgi:hypothetical protein
MYTEHQRHQDLVRVEARAQERRDRRPQRAADRARDDHRRQQQRSLAAEEGQREAAGRDPAHDELALGADVPHIGAKTDGQPDRDQHQRRRLQEQLRDRIRILQRIQEEDGEAFERILAERREDDQPAVSVSPTAITGDA